MQLMMNVKKAIPSKDGFFYIAICNFAHAKNHGINKRGNPDKSSKGA